MRSSTNCRGAKASRLRRRRSIARSSFCSTIGFIYKIESRNAYAPCEHLGHAHHGVLLLCDKCGRSDEIEDMGLDRLLKATAARAGFAPHRQMVELVGLCRACAA